MQDNEAVIDSGLNPGEQVVVTPPEDKLQAGMKVVVTAERDQQMPQAPRAESHSSAATSAGAATQSAAVPTASAAAAPQVTPSPKETPTPAALPNVATSPAQPAEATSSAKAGEGSFMIAARDAVVGRKVYFWGPQWAKRNGFRGAATLRQFKGYAQVKEEGGPSCRGTWQHDPGSSACRRSVCQT
jgi:hypothetical protein